MIRFGILNIFWFGLLPPNDTLDVGFYHSPADDERVRDLIAFADLQVLALVEIVDVKRLETILATLPGKWRARDPNNEVVASKTPGAVADALQRVVFAWNDDEMSPSIGVVRFTKGRVRPSSPAFVIARAASKRQS